MLKKTFMQKAFIEIVEERANKVAFLKAQEDQVYLEAEKEFHAIFDLFTRSLSNDEQRRLFADLENAWNFLGNLMGGHVYRQGIQDSQMIHKELSEFGISVTKESVL